MFTFEYENIRSILFGLGNFTWMLSLVALKDTIPFTSLILPKKQKPKANSMFDRSKLSLSFHFGMK